MSFFHREEKRKEISIATAFEHVSVEKQRRQKSKTITMQKVHRTIGRKQKRFAGSLSKKIVL